jgi:hypothetical protein
MSKKRHPSFFEIRVNIDVRDASSEVRRSPPNYNLELRYVLTGFDQFSQSVQFDKWRNDQAQLAFVRDSFPNKLNRWVPS